MSTHRGVEAAGPLTLESVRQAVAELIGEPADAIGADDDLISRGADSLAIMRLSMSWRRHGIELTFAELFERPTVSAWWQLIAARMAVPESAPADPVCADVDERAPFDLAPMQQAYGIGRRDDQVLGGITPHYYVEIDGTGIDPVRLERAMHAVAARHGMLRAQFLPDGRQQILPHTPWRGLTIHDLREAGAAAVDEQLRRLRAELSRDRLAVESGHVFDVQLSLLPDNGTRLHVNITMLVCDARSFQIILHNLTQSYQTPDAVLPSGSYSFPRYLAERSPRRAQAVENAREYWRARVAELPAGPALPQAAAPATLHQPLMERRTRRISAEQKAALTRAARSHSISLPVAMMTAFAEALGAWSADPRFLLNVPVFDRDEWHPAIGELVGDFSNVVLVDVETGADVPFVEQARRIHARLVAHAAHAAYPGVEVIRDLARLRPGQGIVAPVVFTSVIGMGELFGAEFRRCFGTPMWISSETPQVWIDHQITESDGGLLLNLEFIADLFPEGLVDAMFEGYGTIVDWLSGGPERWHEAIPALLPAEQQAIRAAVNATDGPLPDGLLHARIFEQAAAQPERVALAWGERDELTYGELAGRARAVAAAIVQRRIGPGAVVAVNAPRGAAQIAAALGVVASGNTLLPLGIDQPAHRRALILEKARAAAVLTTTPDQTWPPGVLVMDIETALQSEPLPALLEVSPDQLAYVIYTSGSTGTPKGVEITHRAALNTVDDINHRFGITRDDRVLAVSSLDFDLAIYDIFGVLSAGGALVLIDEDDRRDARRWLRLTTSRGVTVWNSVPALLEMLLIAAESAEAFLPLRIALVSGDWVGLDLPSRLERRTSSCRFVALGGATEASIWSNACVVDRVLPHWRSIPYGFPLRNQRFRIVDHRGRDCPDWVPGELWIGGAGVAQGYRNEPQLTAERFVVQDGSRWYRTGDRGCYWPDGTIEFLGRTDLQVKVRGHRIELNEIEAVLQMHPLVARAVAVVRSSAGTSAGISTVEQIAAAVVHRGGSIDIRQLQAFAVERLPAYMVPQRILVLEELPVTANGKIDRRAIELLLAAHEEAACEDLPASGSELAIAALWADLLKAPHVGRGDEFFSLGGDSLQATRLLELIDRRFGVTVAMRQFMANPTVAGLASAVDAHAEQIEEGII